MPTSPDSVTYTQSISEIVGPTEAAPWENTLRPTNPWLGLFGYDTLTDRFEFYDGTWRHPLWTSGGTITGNLRVDGTLSVGGATTLDSTLGVTGASTFTGMLTANGAITTRGALRTTGNIVASGTQSASNATAVWAVSNVSGSFTSTGSYAINLLSTTDTATGIGGNRALLLLAYTAGTGSTDVAWGLDISTGTSGTTGDFNAGGAFAMGGIRSTARVQHNQGGTGTGPGETSGALWSANLSVAALAGATNLNAVRGAEINVAIQTGASARYITGIKITKQGQTDGLDSAYESSHVQLATGFTSSGFRSGILVGGGDSYWPFYAESAVIDGGRFSIDNSAGQPAYGGVDLWAIDFSDLAFRSSGDFGPFLVEPSGATHIGAAVLEPTAAGLEIDVVGSYATAVAIAAGGTGVTAGDVYTFGNAGAVYVDTAVAGAATAVTMIKAPYILSGSPPANPLSTAIAGQAAGSGLTLNVTWSSAARALSIQPSGGDITIGVDKVAIDAATGQTVFGATEFRKVTVFRTAGDTPSAGMRTFDVKRVGNDDSAIPGDADWVTRLYWVLTGGTGAVRGPRFNTYVATDSQAGAEPGETWGLLSSMQTCASIDSTAAVANYAQMVRNELPSGVGAGKRGVPMLGAVIEARDLTGEATSISGVVRTLELDMAGNGADDLNIGREVMPIVLIKHDAGGADMEVRSIIGVYNPTGGVTVSWFCRPNIEFDTSLYDCRGSTQLAGAHVFWAKTNQTIALDDAGAAGAYGNDANTTISSDGTTITLTGELKIGAAGAFAANDTVATTLTSVGPVGANTTVQEWLEVTNSAGTKRYIPCF